LAITRLGLRDGLVEKIAKKYPPVISAMITRKTTLRRLRKTPVELGFGVLHFRIG
jgi:hypothetical protein